MNSPVSQIKERLTIEEVVSSYIKLERSGSNSKARCPFHNEKTPSFFISGDRGTYYCFGCGASGDIFSFVEEFEGLDFKGALKLLADRAGVDLGNFSKEQTGEKDRLYKIMEEATLYFISNLKDNTEALQYLKSRGLEEKTIKEFRIGFIKDDWRLLYNYLKTKGYKDEEIEKAGLVKKSEKGYYDRFRNRIMFPISDSSSRVIAFSGRLFQDDGKSAKYLNSPETPIFSKSATLYGLDKAKNAIRNNNFSILVEGQMDLILSHQALYRNTIATSGTALSDSETNKENAVSNLGLVRRLSNNIVLAFDGDKAGINATSRAGKIALSLGMDVKVASLPEGVDPADLISKEGLDAWKNVVKNSKHLIEFLLDRVILDCKGDERKMGREIKDKVLFFVDILPSAIEKSHFLKKISDITAIPLLALEDDMKKLEKEQKFEKQEIEDTVKNTNNLYRKDYIERKLLGIIFWQKSLKNPIINTDEILADLALILKKDSKEIIENNQINKEDLIFEAEVFYSNTPFDKEIKELLLNLKEEYLKEELGLKMRELHRAEEEKDQNKSIGILKEINDINQQIQNIKNGRLK